MKEFLWHIRVYYEDTDCGGVVYHTQYLNFMERARTEMLRSVGFEQDELVEKENVIFAVRSLSVDYLKPSKFNDLLRISNSIRHLGHASMTFDQSVIRHADDSLLCKAEVRIACLQSDTLLPCPIPENIRREFNHAD